MSSSDQGSSDRDPSDRGSSGTGSPHPRSSGIGASDVSIRYVESVEGVRPDQLSGFFEGWPNPPTPERHLAILAGSDHFVLAIDDNVERVVGFVNAISDGVLSAYLPLLEVLPEYRGRGIGRELARRIVVRLDHLYMIDLCCDDSLVPFYRSLGFHRFVGMGRRNYDRQSGGSSPRQ